MPCSQNVTHKILTKKRNSLFWLKFCESHFIANGVITQYVEDYLAMSCCGIYCHFT